MVKYLAFLVSLECVKVVNWMFVKCIHMLKSTDAYYASKSIWNSGDHCYFLPKV